MMSKRGQCQDKLPRNRAIRCMRQKMHGGLHRNGGITWKQRPKKPKRDEQVYCVYLEKTGRTEKGIYQRHVRIVGDIAFVLGDNGGRTADIIPAINVFATREEANSYLGGTGIEMWVVGQDGRADLPEMFKGRVVRYVHEVYCGPRHHSTLVMRPDGTTFNGSYGLKTYTSKKQAESDYAHRWREKFKEAAKDIKEGIRIISELEKIRPRSKRAA